MNTLSFSIGDQDIPVYKSLIYEENTIKQGIYDISNEEYHSSIGLSRSGLMEFTRTPFHYWSNYFNKPEIEKEETDSMRIGSILHKFILERDKFYDEFIVVKKVDGRTKEGKEYNKYVESIKGSKHTLNENEFALIKNISASLMKNPTVMDLMSDAEYEKSIYWKDKDTGVLCKSRPDIWHPNVMIDLKSTKDASEDEFLRSAYRYGYDIQAAFMNQAVKTTLNVDIVNFIFILVEKEYPHAHAVYQLDPFDVERSVSYFKTKLYDFKDCLSKNDWPSYPEKTVSLAKYSRI